MGSDEISLDVPSILTRLRDLNGVKTNVDLAKELGVAHSTLGSWRNRSTMPLELLLQQSLKHNTSLDFIIHGINEERAHRLNYVEHEILEISIERALTSEFPGEKGPKQFAQLAAGFYDLYVQLYKQFSQTADHNPDQAVNLLKHFVGFSKKTSKEDFDKNS